MKPGKRLFLLIIVTSVYCGCTKEHSPEPLPDVVDSIVGNYRVFATDILLPFDLLVDTLGFDTLVVTKTAADSFSIAGNVFHFDISFQTPEDSIFIFKSLFDINTRFQYGTFFLYNDSIILIDKELSGNEHSPAIYYTGKKILN